MESSAIELIKEGNARGAWALDKRNLRRLACFRPRSIIARVAWEHEAVDHQRLLARCEQLREPHLHSGTGLPGSVEDVVLRYDAPRRQAAPGCRHLLHLAPQVALLLQQTIACGPVLGRLSWEPNHHRSSFSADLPDVQLGLADTPRIIASKMAEVAQAGTRSSPRWAPGGATHPLD